MKFKNCVVAVTGACSGIGKMLCEEFLKAGAIVNRFDINPETLKETKEGYQDYVVDVSCYESVKNAMDEILQKFQRIDIVINCAGGASTRVFKENVSFEKLSIEAIDWGIDVNLKGPLYMARACINAMIEQKSGVIINVGSVSGVTGSGTAVDYSAAKSGLIGLTKSLALLGGPHQVRCCMVSPGPVLTRPEMAKMTTPLGRACETEEVVKLILYLCSEDAAFITGDNYIIDGGRSCGGMKHAN